MHKISSFLLNGACGALFIAIFVKNTAFENKMFNCGPVYFEEGFFFK